MQTVTALSGIWTMTPPELRQYDRSGFQPLPAGLRQVQAHPVNR